MSLVTWIIAAIAAIIIGHLLRRVYDFLCYRSIIEKIPGLRSIFFVGFAYDMLFVKPEGNVIFNVIIY